jgi:hypothetical protein
MYHARSRCEEHSINSFLENMNERDHLGDTSIHGDNIKMELKEYAMRMMAGIVCFRIE